jgi:hypothetical protein
MGQVILGGTQYKRYPDPSVSNLPNAQGLYAWSMLYANLYFLNAGDAQKEGSLPDETPIDLLLFLSDIPGIGQLKCYHAGATNAHQFTDISNEVSVPFLVTTPAGASAVTVNIGQVAQGYTGDTGAVRCTGFPARGVADVVGVATVDEIAVLVWANGGVMNAPVSQNKDAGSQIVPQPMILRSTDYSEAIRAANNVFKDGNDYLWLVVGLYETAPPALAGNKG